MNFEYRVKGKVEQSFILRGHCNSVGTLVDLFLFGNELEFVKERCSDVEITNLKDKPNVSINNELINSPKPMLEQKTETKPKGVKNELQTKSNGNANKGKHKANIQLA